MNESTDYLVSVCVITYNHEEFIEECLDSILSQKTTFKFCVFVSDDCSTDNTFQILKKYAEKYDNIFIQSRCGLPKSSVNGRPTGNMNFIENFKRATTKYISYCDGDDKWTSDNKLQIQIDYLEKNADVAIACSSKNKIVNNVFHPAKSFLGDLKFSYRWLYFFNPISASSATFRSELFSQPPEWFFSKLDVGDWPFWFLISKGKKIFRSKTPLLNYRVHPTGAWTQKKSSEKVTTYLNVICCLKKINTSPLLSLSYSLHYLRFLYAKTIEWIMSCSRVG